MTGTRPPIEIGPYRLRGRVLLAPMAGVTDRPFRDLCAREGAAWAASEMISSDTTLHATDKTRHRVAPSANGLPHAVQIAGSEPERMAEAAAFNVSLGAEVIDINMGCPAKKVCNRLAGSALLADPARVRAILAAVVRRVSVPVTLKIRTGPSPERRNGVEIARIAESEGVACLAVHGRTRADLFRGDAEHETTRAIVEAVSIPVIANGDVRSVEDARRVLARSGAAGVMIGRAAQGNPWLFREIGAALEGRPAPPPPSREALHETLLEHLRALHALYGEQRGLRIARKHIAWYCRGVENAAAFRAELNRVDGAARQLALVSRFLERPGRFALAA